MKFPAEVPSPSPPPPGSAAFTCSCLSAALLPASAQLWLPQPGLAAGLPSPRLPGGVAARGLHSLACYRLGVCLPPAVVMGPVPSSELVQLSRLETQPQACLCLEFSPRGPWAALPPSSHCLPAGWDGGVRLPFTVQGRRSCECSTGCVKATRHTSSGTSRDHSSAETDSKPSQLSITPPARPAQSHEV